MRYIATMVAPLRSPLFVRHYFSLLPLKDCHYAFTYVAHGFAATLDTLSATR